MDNIHIFLSVAPKRKIREKIKGFWFIKQKLISTTPTIYFQQLHTPLKTHVKTGTTDKDWKTHTWFQMAQHWQIALAYIHTCILTKIAFLKNKMNRHIHMNNTHENIFHKDMWYSCFVYQIIQQSDILLSYKHYSNILTQFRVLFFSLFFFQFYLFDIICYYVLLINRVNNLFNKSTYIHT